MLSLSFRILSLSLPMLCLSLPLHVSVSPPNAVSPPFYFSLSLIDNQKGGNHRSNQIYCAHNCAKRVHMGGTILKYNV
ncbi:hypothetical protein FKM82_006705 [Ascaphus truei]